MKKCFHCGENIYRSNFPKMTDYNWNLKNHCDSVCKKNHWNNRRPTKKETIPVIEKECLNCNKIFKVLETSGEVYCSNNCKKSHIRTARQKAKEMRDKQKSIQVRM